MSTRIYNTSGEYYSVTATSYLDIPNNNSDTLSKVESYLISSKDIDIKTVDRNELIIHIYEEATDIEHWVPLSTEFIADMTKRGYQIVCRLGAGSGHMTFLAYDGTKFVTLLLNDNLAGGADEIEDWREVFTLEFEEKVISLPEFPLYFNKVYDIFYSSIPYSDNTEYRRLSMPNYEDRPIYVLEYLSYTVEQMIINKRSIWSKDEYLIFKEQVASFLDRAFTYLFANKYSYDDVKPDNIMVGYCSGLSYLKLIDVESVSVLDRGEKSIKRSIAPLIDEMDTIWNA